MAPQESYYGSLRLDAKEESPRSSFVTAKRVAVVTLVALAVVGAAFFVSTQATSQAVAVTNVLAAKKDCVCKGGGEKCLQVKPGNDAFLKAVHRKEYADRGVHMCEVADDTCDQDVSGRKPTVHVAGQPKMIVCSLSQKGCSQFSGLDKLDECGEHGFCIASKVPSDSTHECICDLGYEVKGGKCMDMKECQNAKYPCDANAICTNTDGSYTCKCKPEWYGDGKSCTDRNRCGKSNPCKNGGTCNDIVAPKSLGEGVNRGFTCSCKAGWLQERLCETDINECKRDPITGKNKCGANAKCTNTPGSFLCECRDNYKPSPGTKIAGKPGNLVCTDINDCATKKPCLHGGTCSEGPPGCGRNENDALALKRNPDTFKFAPGVCYTCTCVHGWSGKNCEDDENECTEAVTEGKTKTPGGTIKCDTNAYCVNTAGSFTCTCNLGWTGQGLKGTCIDADDCEFSPCNHGGTCIDCGTLCFTCDCVLGWRGTTCGVDWNECLMGIHNCNEHATCLNTPGSYACRCDPGFTGNGVGSETSTRDSSKNKNSPGCHDMDDCAKKPCKHGSCRDLGANHFKCTCIPGYEDGNCDRNINECNPLTGVNRCSMFAECINRDPASDKELYQCKCNHGYEDTTAAKKGYVCTDIDDCVYKATDAAVTSGKKAVGAQKCHSHGFCTDLGNTYNRCVCDKGWQGADCDRDIDECTDLTHEHKCKANTVCVNTPGSYTCKCVKGYAPEGAAGLVAQAKLGCKDINDCETASAKCKGKGVKKCEDDGVGNYKCTCKAGWKDYNCDFDVDECREMKSGKGGTNCAQNAKCVNTRGSFFCRCLAGFVGNGVIKTVKGGTGCKDINDCVDSKGKEKLNVCSSHGKCKDMGANKHKCVCQAGWGCDTARDLMCSNDCNECASAGACHVNADCTNRPGDYKCTCKKGYYDQNQKADQEQLDGHKCKECENCEARKNKFGKVGGFKTATPCTDRAQSVCENIDECATKTHDCHAQATCTDQRGYFSCSCNAGFWGDGRKGSVKKCKACTVCRAGYHEVNPCTSTSDRTCEIDLPTGDYMIESEADGNRQCLVMLRNEWFPTRVNMGNSVKYCGMAMTPAQRKKPLQTIVKSYQEAVWRMRSLYANREEKNTDLYTIEHKNMEVLKPGQKVRGMRCLYFGNNGQDVYPSLASCKDYASTDKCPWGNNDAAPFCDFTPVGAKTVSLRQRRAGLVNNKLAIFKVTAVKMIENKYILQSAARANKNGWECLAFEEQGAATHPSRYNWGNGGTWCGVGDWNGYGKQVALMNNKQAVFIFTQLQAVAGTKSARTKRG